MQQRAALSVSLSLSLPVCLFLSEPTLVTTVTGEQKEKQKVYRYRYFLCLLFFRKHMRCQSKGKAIDFVSSHSFVVLFTFSIPSSLTRTQACNPPFSHTLSFICGHFLPRMIYGISWLNSNSKDSFLSLRFNRIHKMHKLQWAVPFGKFLMFKNSTTLLKWA